MSFFSRLFSTPDRTPLPTFEELLQAREISPEMAGLEPFRKEFTHMKAEERTHWADALAENLRNGWPLPPEWVDAQFDLLPQVVPLWLAEKEGYYYRPHIEGLALRILVMGQPMPSPWLALWGLSVEDVLERAMDHLRERSKDKPFKRLPSGIYQAEFQDGHASSRILLPELWSGLFVGQNTFVAVPTEDQLLLAPQVLLPKLLEGITASLAAPGKRLLATIFQQVDNHYLPANLQDPHPMAQPQRELRQSDLAEAYHAQEDVLADQGTPAPLGMLRTQQGKSVSVATWQEGPATLLPDSDLVAFVAATGEPLGIFFRQTLPRISGLHGEPVECWGPRRLRYDRFPTVAELDRLECFATGEQMAGIAKNAAQAARPAAPRSGQEAAASGGLSGQAASPLPPHLRGLSLGVQGND
jgi:hypothetical protein